MTTPYRDDFAAAHQKLTELEQELLTVRTKAHELSSLRLDEATLARRIVELKRRLDGMTKKRALPLLESVRIASPCKADWNAMTGDERVRFCPQCEKNVFNLSGMPREEAERFVRDNVAGACVRLHRRTDGTVLTADCPVGRKRKRLRNVALATVGGSMLAAGALFSWRSPISTSAGLPEAPIASSTAHPLGEWVGGTPADQPTMGAFAPDASEKITTPPTRAASPKTPPARIKHR